MISTGNDSDNPSARASHSEKADRKHALRLPNVGDDDLGDARALLGLLNPELFAPERFGTDQGAEVHVSVGLADYEFADLVWTSGQTLSEILRDFEDRSWVRRESGAVVVLDRLATQRLADQSSRRPPSSD